MLPVVEDAVHHVLIISLMPKAVHIGRVDGVGSVLELDIV